MKRKQILIDYDEYLELEKNSILLQNFIDHLSKSIVIETMDDTSNMFIQRSIAKISSRGIERAIKDIVDDIAPIPVEEVKVC